jgi:hypothetical protein
MNDIKSIAESDAFLSSTVRNIAHIDKSNICIRTVLLEIIASVTVPVKLKPISVSELATDLTSSLKDVPFQP